MAVEHTREHAKSLTVANSAILWNALDITRQKYRHSQSKEVRFRSPATAITVSDAQSMTARTRFLCTGVSKGSQNRGSTWLCGRCGRIYDCREGSRRLPMRHSSEPNDVALCTASHMPEAGNAGAAGDQAPSNTTRFPPPPSATTADLPVRRMEAWKAWKHHMA